MPFITEILNKIQHGDKLNIASLKFSIKIGVKNWYWNDSDFLHCVYFFIFLFTIHYSKNIPKMITRMALPYGHRQQGRTSAWGSYALWQFQSHWLWSPSWPQRCLRCLWISHPTDPRWGLAAYSDHTMGHLDRRKSKE